MQQKVLSLLRGEWNGGWLFKIYPAHICLVLTISQHANRGLNQVNKQIYGCTCALGCCAFRADNFTSRGYADLTVIATFFQKRWLTGCTMIRWTQSSSDLFRRNAAWSQICFGPWMPWRHLGCLMSHRPSVCLGGWEKQNQSGPRSGFRETLRCC